MCFAFRTETTILRVGAQDCTGMLGNLAKNLRDAVCDLGLPTQTALIPEAPPRYS